jgi:hypothetical protein
MTPPTPPAPGEHTPPPVHYPGTGGHAGHRLRARAILAILAVILLIAASLTGAVVLPSAQSPRPAPRTVAPGSHVAMAVDSEPASVPAPAQAAGVPVHDTTAVSGARVVLASANSIDLGSGISLTPAPGWTTDIQKPHAVILFNADSSASFAVVVGPANEGDVVAQLQDDINALTTGPDADVTNAQLTKVSTIPLQSKVFQQEATIGYTATMSLQQGTSTVSGVFGELLNTATGESAFVDFRALSDDVAKKFAPDADAMIGSML